MKQKIFTLVLMLVMVFVASSAWAQGIVGGNQQPFVGQTYSYTLGGIVLTGDATATITVPATMGTASETSIDLTSSSTELSFTVDYLSTATSGNINVSITYDAVNGCTNEISLAIAPVASPSFTLAASATTDIVCMDHSGTTNNQDGASTSTVDNTFEYAIDLTTTAVAGFTYDYTLTLSAATINGSAISVSSSTGTASIAAGVITVTGATADDVLTLTFPSAEGAQVILTGTLSAGELHLDASQSGGDITCTDYGTPASKTIGAIPTIGSFTVN